MNSSQVCNVCVSCINQPACRLQMNHNCVQGSDATNEALMAEISAADHGRDVEYCVGPSLWTSACVHANAWTFHIRCYSWHGYTLRDVHDHVQLVNKISCIASDPQQTPAVSCSSDLQAVVAKYELCMCSCRCAGCLVSKKQACRLTNEPQLRSGSDATPPMWP
jgi:hypothetical protein